jgi:hypothetical protein
VGKGAKPEDLLGDLVKWFFITFGKDILVAVKDGLQHQWRRAFAARNILILGPKRTGKSSLMQYLLLGHPYEIVEGEIRPPQPTAMAAVVDAKFAVGKGNWLRLKKDLAGDAGLRDVWGQAIKDIRPHGIIYMIDGRRDDETLREDVRGIEQYVLAHYAENGIGELASIHVFVNFVDQWATSPIEARRRLRVAHDELDAVIAMSPAWATLRAGVSGTQLAPVKKNKWDEAERALRHFGADLGT